MSSSYSGGGPRMGGMSQMNGNNRRPSNPPHNQPHRMPSTEKPQPVHSQHEDLVQYMKDSWTKVHQDYGDRNSGSSVVYHTPENPENNPVLKDFVPFDLEGFWGMRMVQSLQHQQSHHS